MAAKGTEIILDSALISSFAPQRPIDGHKGTFGEVLVCAGSRYMQGAQVLCTGSALRSGAGLVRVLAPDDAIMSTQINEPCAIITPLEKDVNSVRRQAEMLLKKSRCAAIGPGIDTEDARYDMLLKVLLENSRSLVIDAGAITLMARKIDYYKLLLKNRIDSGYGPAVLTPHVGEFKRLLHIENEEVSEAELESKCVQFARENKCIVILKKHKTIISTPHSGWYSNSVGNDGMAKGGSGDVLTGLVAGFCAQGISEEISAVSGVYIHALAGTYASECYGKRAVLPIDYMDLYTKAFEKVGW